MLPERGASMSRASYIYIFKKDMQNANLVAEYMNTSIFVLLVNESTLLLS
jgi:hypothetical protein